MKNNGSENGTRYFEEIRRTSIKHILQIGTFCLRYDRSGRPFLTNGKRPRIGRKIEQIYSHEQKLNGLTTQGWTTREHTDQIEVNMRVGLSEKHVHRPVAEPNVSTFERKRLEIYLIPTLYRFMQVFTVLTIFNSRSLSKYCQIYTQKGVLEHNSGITWFL